MAGPINRFSSRITQPKSQGASQAQLFATGFTKADLDKAQIGIGSIWYEGNNCNMHLLGLAEKVKEGVESVGIKGMRFNTVGVSDGMSMGTEGMSFSLQSRDLIADSIETVTRGQWYDGLVTIPGCDKNMPGCLMAMGRINRPSIMVYGGTIRGGRMSNGEVVDIVNAFQSYGQFLAGTIDEGERSEIVRNACPGPGACGGMYTANTMATAIEAMGMSLPYSSSTPATDPAKLEECLRAGAVVRELMEKDIKPRDIMTRTAFENAMVMVMALGGSTNAVLHLIAMARAVDVDLTIDEFQSVSDRIPYIADLKPSGKYVMEDLHRIGGVPAVMKYLLAEGLIDGDCLTCTGRTIAENLEDADPLADGQPIVYPLGKPIKESGHICILRGNLAPGGAVAKITGKEGLRFEGPANVFDAEEDMLRALEEGKYRQGRCHRHPLRGTEGRTGHAGDADSDLRGHGGRPRVRRRADHRWPLLRRVARLHHRARGAGGAGRRTHRADRDRRPRHHRRGGELHSCRRAGRGDGAAPRGVDDARVQGEARHLVQVHQERVRRLARVRDRRVDAGNAAERGGRNPAARAVGPACAPAHRHARPPSALPVSGREQPSRRRRDAGA